MNATLLVLIAALTVTASAGTTAAARESFNSPSAAVAAATDPIRGVAVIANPESGTLQFTDLRSLQTTHSISVGTNPRGVIVNAVSGTAYVVDDTAPGWLVAVDIESRAVLGRTAVGNRPSHIAADLPRGELYVANRADGTISIVDATTMKVLGLLQASGEPDSLSVDPRRGLLYAVSGAQRTVAVFDLNHRHLAASVGVGANPGTATVDERSGKVYLNNIDDNTVSVIDPARFQVVRTIPSGTGSTAGTISPVHRRYYLPSADDNRLTVFDTEHDQVVALVSVGSAPGQAILSATDEKVYVVNRDDASISVVDAESASVDRTLSAGWRPKIALALDGYVLTVNEMGVSSAQSAFATTLIGVPETALATEYADVKRQRYLHSADSREVRLIADGLYGDEWRRTMRFFRVWTNAAEGRVPVCQFSRAAELTSSRVFAATPGECKSLEADPAWRYEGVSYYVALPGPDGNCAPGTEPLYRLYNNGQNEVIAHRYVRDAGVRDTMANAGWTSEGHGRSVIYACVPPLQASVSTE